MNEISKTDFDNNDGESSFLIFSSDNEQFAVPLLQVREIRGWSGVTKIPHAPESIRGVMNVRGQILPVCDLRQCLKSEETITSEKHVVIIIMLGDRDIGLLVDSVKDILSSSEESIQKPPQESDEWVEGLLNDSEEKLVILLNTGKMLKSIASKVNIENIEIETVE